GIESIAQGTIESFHMYRASWLHPCPQRGADLHGEQSSMLIAMLDRLRQRDHLWDDPGGTPSFACRHPLAIGPLEDAPIAVPSIPEPVQFALMGPLDGGDHG